MISDRKSKSEREESRNLEEKLLNRERQIAALNPLLLDTRRTPEAAVADKRMRGLSDNVEEEVEDHKIVLGETFTTKKTTEIEYDPSETSSGDVLKHYFGMEAAMRKYVTLSNIFFFILLIVLLVGLMRRRRINNVQAIM